MHVFLITYLALQYYRLADLGLMSNFLHIKVLKHADMEIKFYKVITVFLFQHMLVKLVKAKRDKAWEHEPLNG